MAHTISYMVLQVQYENDLSLCSTVPIYNAIISYDKSRLKYSEQVTAELFSFL